MSPDKAVVLLYLLNIAHDMNNPLMVNSIDDKIKVTIDKCLKKTLDLEHRMNLKGNCVSVKNGCTLFYMGSLMALENLGFIQCPDYIDVYKYLWE